MEMTAMKTRRSANRTVTAAVLILSSVSALQAQQSADELAQKAANPIADLMSVPFQNNTDFGLGDFDRTRNVLNIQPVIPLAGGRVITRTIIPFVWLPDIDAESGSLSSGLSDILFTAFYVPPSGALMWGVGPVVEFPTGGASRGSQKWNIGPSAVALTQAGPWTLGILANNVWSIAGESERNDVNKGLIQYFIVRQLGNGWYVNSAPIITVNWKLDSDQRWVVPFGAGGGKLVFLGKLPVNIQSQVYYNVVKPDIGPDWQLRVQVQVLLPAPGSR
ncbi:MAG: neuromedin U [Gemmatimonadota bacterium]|nr:MAG: neuromedin U [Gemmatimonadota bacterium]